MPTTPTASTSTAIPAAIGEQSLQESSAPTSRQSTHSNQVEPVGHVGSPAAHSKIKWPQSLKKSVWHQFDEDVDRILEGTAKGDVELRLKTMTSIIVSIAAERFGAEEVKSGPSVYTPNNRARKIQCLREELKALKRRYKKAGDVEKGGLSEVRAILREKLMTLWRAENHRRRRKERARRRAEFLANPFKLTKKLLGQKR